jgi:hypothetical protein
MWFYWMPEEDNRGELFQIVGVWAIKMLLLHYTGAMNFKCQGLEKGSTTSMSGSACISVSQITSMAAPAGNTFSCIGGKIYYPKADRLVILKKSIPCPIAALPYHQCDGSL